MVNTSRWAEVQQIKVDRRDLLLVRAGADVPQRWVESLYGTVKTANPDWEGTVLVIGMDQDVRKLTRVEGRELYEQLRPLYEAKAPPRRHKARSRKAPVTTQG